MSSKPPSAQGSALNTTVGITAHCAQRYRERVAPTMTTAEARCHLANALAGRPLHADLPWVVNRQRGWLAEVEPGVALAVCTDHRGGLAGTTVITRGDQ